MKFWLFRNFFRSISKPMTKRRKYIPSSVRKLKVCDVVIVSNGFWIERMTPSRREANIQGTRSFSKRLPSIKVKINASARKRNMSTIFGALKGMGYLIVFVVSEVLALGLC